MPGSQKLPRIAIVFWRLGPYHHARLNAAGRVLDIFGIEACGAENTYAWDKVEGADYFRRITLTDRFSPTREWRIHLHQRMAQELQNLQPDVVVIPGWILDDALAAINWCAQNNIPLVTMSESTAWDEPRKAWKESVKRRIVGLCSAALVGGTPHRDYIVQLGMPADRVFLGYDAVDNEYFQQNAEKLKSETLTLESRKKYALPENYFLASNRFIEKKNLPRLLEAYALYRKKAEASSDPRPNSDVRPPASDLRPLASDLRSPTSGLRPPASDLRPLSSASRAEALAKADDLLQSRRSSREGGRPPTSDLHPRFSSPGPSSSSPVVGGLVVPWSLVLLGDGELRSDLCHLISDLRLQHCVLLPGFKQYPELPHYYAHAGAFIHASTTEQWGLVVNEAMASGLPVLVSNRCGCARDLVKEGVNGFTFDPYNVEQMAEVMFQISAFQPFRLSEFGDASKRVIADWGCNRFAQGMKDAVECALRVGPIKPTLTQRAILKALLSR